MNDFHLIYSWFPFYHSEPTKRQAKRMIKKLKVSEQTKFVVVTPHEDCYEKVSIAFWKKPPPPHPTIPNPNTRMLVPNREVSHNFKKIGKGVLLKYQRDAEYNWHNLFIDHQLALTKQFHIYRSKWVVWNSSLIFMTKEDELKKFNLLFVEKLGNINELFVEDINEKVRNFICVDNKTGDIYYTLWKGGLWKNKEKIVDSKEKLTVTIEKNGIYISELEGDEGYARPNETRNIHIYDAKAKVVSKLHTIRIADYGITDHKWINFKGVSICAVLIHERNRAIIELYAFHKKIKPALIKTLQIKVNKNKMGWPRVSDIQLFPRESILDILCCYQWHAYGNI